jgi:hypothetical protein
MAGVRHTARKLEAAAGDETYGTGFSSEVKLPGQLQPR